MKKMNFFDDVIDKKIPEEELEQIKPYSNHNFPSPTMNLVIMDIYYKDPDNFIHEPDYFSQYLC